MNHLVLKKDDQVQKVFLVARTTKNINVTYSNQFGFILEQDIRFKEFSSLDQMVLFELCLDKLQSKKINGALFDFELVEGPEFLPLNFKTNKNEKDASAKYMTVAMLVLLLCFMLFTKSWKEAEKLEEIVQDAKVEEFKPLEVRIRPIVSQVIQTTPTQTSAIQKKPSIGFLGLLGKQDLKKALGGLPTNTNGSAGAGRGGNEGSGGQSLADFGSGLKNVSIGNGGVQGLGGVGTKGKGGGAGGYGNVDLSGEGGTSLGFKNIQNQVYLEGGLSKDVIEATIRRYLSQIRYCYELGLQEKPGLQGRVLSDFIINGDGSVKTSKIAASTLRHNQVETCIQNKILGWKFPLPKGGVDTPVKYPFMLHPTKG